MKKGLRFFVAIFMAAGILSGIAHGQTDIGVAIDGKTIDFENEPLIMNGRTLAPFREIFEYFDAEVVWSSADQSVWAEKDGKEIFLRIGSNEASVDGRTVWLDAPPIIVDSRTYVPLRFIAEGLDAGVYWDDAARMARISTDRSVRLGDSWQDVEKRIGKPSVNLMSRYGFDWYVYNTDYGNYYQIGYKDGKAAALFTNASGYKRDNGFELGLSPALGSRYFGTALSSIKKDNTYFMIAEGPHDTFRTEDSFVTLFYDTYDHRIAGLFEVDADVEMALDGYYGIPSETLSRSYERQIFELTNTERHRRGLSLLAWSQAVHDTAHDHSSDMAANNYYSHYDLLGQSPFDRIKSAGIDYLRAGENIAAGESSAFNVHYDWMNSEGHRTAILGDYGYIGVGVAFGGSYNSYFTQHFIEYR